jgi:hypothetical protein
MMKTFSLPRLGSALFLLAPYFASPFYLWFAKDYFCFRSGFFSQLFHPVRRLWRRQKKKAPTDDSIEIANLAPSVSLCPVRVVRISPISRSFLMPKHPRKMLNRKRRFPAE